MKTENTRRGNGYHLDRCDTCNTVCFPADLSHLYRPSGFNPNKRSLLIEKRLLFWQRDIIIFILISYEGKDSIPAVMKKFFFVKKKKTFPTTALPAMFSSWHPHRIGLKHKMHDSVAYVYHRKLTHRSYNRPSGSSRELQHRRR